MTEVPKMKGGEKGEKKGNRNNGDNTVSDIGCYGFATGISFGTAYEAS